MLSLFDPIDDRLAFRLGTLDEIDPLLREHHYLGPRRRGEVVHVGVRAGLVVAAQVWGRPTSRHLPSDGSWLELARWCLIPAAGENAGSRQHGSFVRWLRAERPEVTTLVSYSDPSVGHTGALYKACNWWWAPTWLRLRPPPTANGQWVSGKTEAVKDRWVFPLRDDPLRCDLLALNDGGAERRLDAIRDLKPAA